MTTPQIFTLLFLLVSTSCLAVDGVQSEPKDIYYYSWVLRATATVFAWIGFIYFIAI